ncbi:MAG: hypothetical protein LDL33_04270 [Desulfomonile sp.]|nr:hypothetical protein [Desulfomonile sp.]
MNDEHRCDSCSMAGCTARQTEEKLNEEISAGTYLVVAMIMIIACSILIKWIF